MKTQNQMLKNEKSTNRIEHQNRKTEIFWHKNRKANQENVQNRKTENPYAPSYKEHANVVKTRQDDKMTRWFIWLSSVLQDI